MDHRELAGLGKQLGQAATRLDRARTELAAAQAAYDQVQEQVIAFGRGHQRPTTRAAEPVSRQAVTT